MVFPLDNPGKFAIIVNAVVTARICSGIEVVITSTTGNRVVVKSGTRVQIPPTAPEKIPVTAMVTGICLWGKKFA
jgi:uncharacterized cupin superfamily protein